MPDRVSRPWRNITRRSVMTKCVVHQLRNGHTVSHPMITNQIDRDDNEHDPFFAVGVPVGLLT